LLPIWNSVLCGLTEGIQNGVERPDALPYCRHCGRVCRAKHSEST